jgi:hypothetical protein
MNLVQENTELVNYHTNLLDVESWLEIKIEDYSWHLSDIEIFPRWEGLTDPCWIKGTDLSTYLLQLNRQFIWAVLSAFPIETEPFLSEIPYAEGNSSLWAGAPSKQLASALFEIVCWDSSATLFIGLPQNLEKNLLKNAPGIKYLNHGNQKRNG